MAFGDCHLCYRCKHKPTDEAGTTFDPNACAFAFDVWISEEYEHHSTSNGPHDSNSCYYTDSNGKVLLERVDNGGGYWITSCKNFSPRMSTNGDAIRSMTDEELAKWLSSFTPYGSEQTWLYWLKHDKPMPLIKEG